MRAHHQAVLGPGLPLTTLDLFGGGEREGETPERHDDQGHDPGLLAEEGSQAPGGDPPH